MKPKLLYISNHRKNQIMDILLDYFVVDYVTFKETKDKALLYDLYVIEETPNIVEEVKVIEEKCMSNIIVISKREGNKKDDLIEKLSDTRVVDIIFEPINSKYLLMKIKGYLNQSLYKGFLDKMSIMAAITNEKSEIVYVNKAFSEETGYGDEAIGCKSNILKSGHHSLMYYNNLYYTLMADMKWEGRFKNKRKNGSYYYEDASIVPIDFIGKKYYGKTAFNVTRQEELVSQNKESEQLAAAIQQALIADDIYEKDIIINTKYIPLESVSGDIYNLYHISDDIYCVFLADVVGHGVASALLSTSIIAIVNDLIKDDYMPDVFLEKLNNRIIALFNANDLSQTTYFTAIYMVVDINNHKIHFANCGHPKVYCISKEKIKGLRKINFFIGMFQNAEYEYDTYTYKEGDKILVYTDGLIEMCHNAKEGRAILEEKLSVYNALEVKPNLVEYIDKEIIKGSIYDRNDDITIINIDLL